MSPSGGSPIWTIRRSAADAKLSGLCGGVARHWNVDPLLVRIGWVLLSLAGVGIVLYVAGWLLVPQDGRSQSSLDELTGGASARWSRQTKLALVIAASVGAFVVLGGITGIGIGPVLVLTAIWYFGYYRNRRSAGRTPAPVPPPIQSLQTPPPFRYPGPATPFTEAATVWRARMEDHLRTTRGAVPTPPPRSAPSAPPSPAETPRPVPAWPLLSEAPLSHAPVGTGPQDPPGIVTADPEREAFLAAPDPVGLYTEPELVPAATAPSLRLRGRSLAARRLRLIGLATLGLVLAGLGIADSLGAAVPPSGYLAAAVLVVGLTLIAATWFGRARGILPVGIALLIALASVCVVHPGDMPREWSLQRTYSAASQLPTIPDRVEIGRLQVDLSNLQLTSDATYAARADIGQVLVRVPTDVNVRIRFEVDQGAVVDGTSTLSSGSDLTGVIEPRPLIAGAPTLTLNLSADLGEVEIQR